MKLRFPDLALVRSLIVCAPVAGAANLPGTQPRQLPGWQSQRLWSGNRYPKTQIMPGNDVFQETFLIRS